MDLLTFQSLQKGDVIAYNKKPNIYWIVESKDIDTINSVVKYKANNSYAIPITTVSSINTICPYNKGCLLISMRTPNGRHNKRQFYIINKSEIENWDVVSNLSPKKQFVTAAKYDLKLFEADSLNIRYLSVHLHFRNKFQNNQVFLDELLKDSSIDTSKIIIRKTQLRKPVYVNNIPYWYCIEFVIGSNVNPITNEMYTDTISPLTGDEISLIKIATPDLIDGPVDIHYFAKDMDGNRVHLNGSNQGQIGFNFDKDTKKVLVNNGDANLVQATPYEKASPTEIELVDPYDHYDPSKHITLLPTLPSNTVYNDDIPTLDSGKDSYGSTKPKANLYPDTNPQSNFAVNNITTTSVDSSSITNSSSSDGSNTSDITPTTSTTSTTSTTDIDSSTI